MLNASVTSSNIIEVINSENSAEESAPDRDRERSKAGEEQTEAQPQGQQRQWQYTCRVCFEKEAEYVCPGCKTRTCSLECVKKHKIDTGCTGRAPLPRATDDSTFSHEVSALLDVGKAIESAARLDALLTLERMGHAMPNLALAATPPTPASAALNPKILKQKAEEFGVIFRNAPAHMSLRKMNSTKLTNQRKKIRWRIRWVLDLSPDQPPTEYIDKAVSHDTTGDVLVARALGTSNLEGEFKQNPESISVLYYDESVPANVRAYLQMPLSSSLKNWLRGCLVVEFPTFVLVRATQLTEKSEIVGVSDTSSSSESSDSDSDTSSSASSSRKRQLPPLAPENQGVRSPPIITLQGERVQKIRGEYVGEYKGKNVYKKFIDPSWNETPTENKKYKADYTEEKLSKEKPSEEKGNEEKASEGKSSEGTPNDQTPTGEEFSEGSPALQRSFGGMGRPIAGNNNRQDTQRQVPPPPPPPPMSRPIEYGQTQIQQAPQHQRVPQQPTSEQRAHLQDVQSQQARSQEQLTRHEYTNTSNLEIRIEDRSIANDDEDEDIVF